jgi:RNA polymerase sigma factor (sigma-70 family)
MTGLPALKLDSIEQPTKIQGKKEAQGEKVIDLFRSKKTNGLTEDDRQELIIEFRLKARKLGRSILRKWHARMDLEEVDSIVDLSLCEAVKRFDPSKGASFMTFLYYHLKGNLIRAVSAAATANAIPASEDANGQAKTVNAIDVAEALCNHDRPLPDEVLFKKQLVRLSKQACSRLDPLEKEVIERIYLGGQQLMDIANSLGYSRCHISRVKKKALETLNNDMQFQLEQEELENEESTVSGAQERRTIHRRRPRSRKALEAQKLVANM